MSCYISGIIGIGLLSATYATISISEQEHKKIRDAYSSDLDRIYDKIVRERRNLYLQGLILGLLLSLLSLKILDIKNIYHKITLCLAITILISVIYYSLMPKSDYMLNHLETKKENQVWLEMYKRMK